MVIDNGGRSHAPAGTPGGGRFDGGKFEAVGASDLDDADGRPYPADRLVGRHDSEFGEVRDALTGERVKDGAPAPDEVRGSGSDGGRELRGFGEGTWTPLYGRNNFGGNSCIFEPYEDADDAMLARWTREEGYSKYALVVVADSDGIGEDEEPEDLGWAVLMRDPIDG